ncbi:MAG: hypothetical protein OXH86_11840 [Acidimicrobiaceae bacterium]|nr:hypothetical protein [Acidimicrobiaceae bacterium]
MSSVEIAVGCQYLKNLATTMRQTASDLEDFARLTNCRLTSSPSVDDAYGDLSGKWDERRGKLAEALETIACSFDTASEEFSTVDSEFAAKLQDD